MARLSDLKWRYRWFMQRYQYRKVDWRPGARLQKPLAQAKLAFITTAAFYLPDQEPFDESLKGGDFTFREIPGDAELASLRIGHRSEAFDHRGIETDKNLALPLDRARELVVQGFIGDLNHRHFSFMGSVTAPGRLIRETAPEVARRLQEDGVDAVVLTPV
ncbi:MAG: glycine/sarcosine/betaine reductase selenoprotein B family protein [Acidobacteriota bacterium]